MAQVPKEALKEEEMEHKPEKCTCDVATRVEVARKALGDVEKLGIEAPIKAAREKLVKLEQEHMKLLR